MLVDKSDTMDQIWTLLTQNNLNSFTLQFAFILKQTSLITFASKELLQLTSHSRKENKHLPFYLVYVLSIP